MQPVMKTFTNRVILNGRVTVPKEIRELLGIGPGDYINAVIIAVASENGRGRTIDHIPAVQRTFTKKLSRDFRVNIPSSILHLLNIKPGDYVTVMVNRVIKGDADVVQEV